MIPGDSDGDGLPDMEEAAYRCNKSLPDSDFDGLLDGWEVEMLNDPNFPHEKPDPASPDVYVEMDWGMSWHKPLTGEEYRAWIHFQIGLMALLGASLITIGIFLFSDVSKKGSNRWIL